MGVDVQDGDIIPMVGNVEDVVIAKAQNPLKCIDKAMVQEQDTQDLGILMKYLDQLINSRDIKFERGMVMEEVSSEDLGVLHRPFAQAIPFTKKGTIEVTLKFKRL